MGLCGSIPSGLKVLQKVGGSDTAPAMYLNNKPCPVSADTQIQSSGASVGPSQVTFSHISPCPCPMRASVLVTSLQQHIPCQDCADMRTYLEELSREEFQVVRQTSRTTASHVTASALACPSTWFLQKCGASRGSQHLLPMRVLMGSPYKKVVPGSRNPFEP